MSKNGTARYVFRVPTQVYLEVLASSHEGALKELVSERRLEMGEATAFRDYDKAVFVSSITVTPIEEK